MQKKPTIKATTVHIEEKEAGVHALGRGGTGELAQWKWNGWDRREIGEGRGELKREGVGASVGRWRMRRGTELQNGDDVHVCWCLGAAKKGKKRGEWRADWRKTEGRKLTQTDRSYSIALFVPPPSS